MQAAPLWVVELFVSPDVAVQRFLARQQATDLDDRLVRERAEAFPYSDDALRLTSSAAAPGDLAIDHGVVDPPAPISGPSFVGRRGPRLGLTAARTTRRGYGAGSSTRK